jgi:hypothetical protein
LPDLTAEPETFLEDKMISRRATLAIGLGAMLAPFTLARAAWAGYWVDLGTRTVKVYGDADRIAVSDNGGIYRRLRISVARNGVHVERATVYFGNGETATYQFDSFVPRGSVSAPIDLPGGGRAILYVDMVYRRRAGGGVAVVTLQGLSA